MMRSNKGLLGLSEEFTLLIKRIMKEDLQAGMCCQIIDNIIIGGATHEEAAANYIAIIKKFQLANIKVVQGRPTYYKSRWMCLDGSGSREES